MHPTRDESGESCDELWKTLLKLHLDMFDLVCLGLKIRVKICKFNDIAPIRMCSIIDACQIKRITFPFDAISLRVADDDR